MPIIKFENVKKSYQNKFSALRGISLVIKSGEFVSIVGRSGAGKTTLVKMIYAEGFPDEGRVCYGERSTDEIRGKLLPFYRRNFGTVFQDFKLLSHKTVFENVAYAAEVIGKTDEEINKTVPQILAVFGLLEKGSKYPQQLSGGEQQRVSLARALINRPDVIIADEPTGNLDPASSMEIMKLLLKINSMGTTVILATHDNDIVNMAKRRVITLEAGKIVSDQNPGKYLI
ncbi:MAG: Cell division ATP-binding protein FtsE [Candidatus Moranbacteria bacterium GW2011_GWE1_35_17]|nr:MAG: Cell division ATP-binding protein FtsE [Candidatus Moranbacteria bacterium GW2011_GWE1_35_17]KKP67883.1 MAG: Cell division ATP-binding protein FtsE [Candidatus Moranbacteria bacterium GW2011_GWE2_35_164]KKP81460.1 MAG: Cell division ATP-binding protein FtsE [Candidatus Moranbacteria bacterium GW2011_GWF1_35_5]KKP81787.1 MAG: Cell division ATP-binding protein FtsE [Candidatus Moranbacteria bacterium GW2011_GWF2_35_54]